MSFAMARRQEHFDALFAASDDPWQTRIRFTERMKRNAALRLLGPPPIGSILELGCGAGAMTCDLAGRCEAVMAVDSSPHALRRAEQALGKLRNVRFAQADLALALPAGCYDVVIASEFLYYLPFRNVRRLLGRVADALAPDGRFISINHVRRFSDAASTIAQVGAAAERAFGAPAATLQVGAWKAEIYRTKRSRKKPFVQPIIKRASASHICAVWRWKRPLGE